MSPRKQVRSQSPWSPMAVAWVVMLVALAAAYFFKRESFWPIFGGLLCPFLVLALIVGTLKKGSGHSSPPRKKRGDWHPSGQSDKEWMEENDRRNLGEDY